MIGFIVGASLGVLLCYGQYRVGNKLFLYVDSILKKKEATTPQ